MAVLNYYNFDELKFTDSENPVEDVNRFYSGRQVGRLNYGLPGQGPEMLDHITLSTDYARIGTKSLCVTLEKPYYRDVNQKLARSEWRAQVYGGSPNVLDGWVSFSWMTPQSPSSPGTSVIYQLWDGGSPSISIRWKYETNLVFIRIHNSDQGGNTDYPLFTANPEKWYDIDMWYLARTNSTGRIRAFVDNDLKHDLIRQTIYSPQQDSTTPYPKGGQYNSDFGSENNDIKICYFDALSYHDNSDSEEDTLAWIANFRNGSEEPYEGPDYYVSNSGSDSNDGSISSPFATLAKINGMDLAPGDQIHLDAASIFRESLSIPTNGDGTSSDRVKIQSYGTGKSKITGAIPVNNWVPTAAPNVYESVDANYPSHVAGLLISGVPTKKGRIPKSSHLEYQTYTSSSITSNQLPDIDYSGGEVEGVIEKAQWVHDRVIVSGRSGNTLNYSGGSSYSGGANKWFFIQNATECLTEQGDWMYSPSGKKLFIFSTVDPNTLDIEIQNEVHAVEGDGNAYTDYENIQIEGSSQFGIRIHVAGYARILNNTVKNHGGTGIAFLSASNGVIENNLVEWCLNKGIDVYNESNNALISKNIVKDIATILGAAGNGDGHGIGIRGFGSGVTYELNRLENIGYIGIYFRYSNTVISRNFLKNYCIRKHDGGGLYCYGGQKDTTTYANQLVNRNILMDGGSLPTDAVYGIYVDDNSEDITITENLFIRAGRAAYFNHNSHEILFNNNIIIGCEKALMFAANGNNELIRNNEVHNNVIAILSKNDVALSAFTEANDIAQFGSFSGNTYLVASNHQIVFNLRYVVSGKDYFECLSWAQWQGMGFDLDSTVQYLDIPEYEILTEGPDLFTGTPSAFLEGGSTSVTVDNTLFPGATKCVVTSPGSATTRVELRPGIVGAVDNESSYLLRFKAAAPSGHQSMVIYVRETGTPYRRLSPDIFAYTGSEMQEFEFLFTDLVASDNASILIEHQSHQGDFYIQDFEFLEVTVVKTDYDEHIKVVYNDTENTETIYLEGNWKDINDTVVEEVELESFESKLLLKSVEIPTYNISASGANGTVTGTGTYNQGDPVSLQANPNPTFRFVKWVEGENEYTDNPYNFTATASRAFTAVFEKITHTITASGDHVTITGAGTHDEGSTAELMAVPDPGYEFVKWTDGDEEFTDNPYSFTVTGSRNLIAVTQKTKHLITATIDNGTVTGAGEIDHGDNATLTAAPGEGFQFVRWEENEEEVSTDNPFIFEVTGPRTLAAVTEPIPVTTYDVVINDAPGGSATGAGTYDKDEEVSVAATPDEGFKFVRWEESEQLVSIYNPYVFNITADRDLTPVFEPVEEPVDPDPEPSDDVIRVKIRARIVDVV